MGLCEEVDSHRGKNHAQVLVEEGFGGVHGLFGVGGGAGSCRRKKRWWTSLLGFDSLPVSLLAPYLNDNY